MGLLNEHRTKIQSRLPIQKSYLEKGMIVEARYKPEHDSAKKYMFLILNANHKKMVHALTLENFNSATLNKLASETGLAYIKRYQKKRKLDIPKLTMEGSSKKFYYSNLKKDISSKYNDSYRTLHLANFTSIILVDYRWNRKLEERFIATLEPSNPKTIKENKDLENKE